jgi:hypothetical protein
MSVALSIVLAELEVALTEGWLGFCLKLGASIAAIGGLAGVWLVHECVMKYAKIRDGRSFDLDGAHARADLPVRVRDRDVGVACARAPAAPHPRARVFGALPRLQATSAPNRRFSRAARW